MARKAKNSNSSGQSVGFTGVVGGSGDAGDSAQVVVDASNESDAAKKQPRVRAKRKRKAHAEDLDPKDKPSQVPGAHPSSMPSQIFFGAPVTHKTVKDLAPTFLQDAKLELSKPDFIRWFIATFPSYRCSGCMIKAVPCEYPAVAVGTQRNFKCTPCRDGRGGMCSWFQDLREAYVREAHQLDAGEAQALASSKEADDPQGTLSSYYQTLLADPAGHRSDNEQRERSHRRRGSKINSAQLDLLQQSSAQCAPAQSILLALQPKPQKRVKLIVSLPSQQPPPPPIQAPLPPPPVTQCSPTPASAQISPGGPWLPPTMPERASLPLLASPPAFSGPCQTLPTPTTVPVIFLPPSTPPTTIAASETRSDASQDYKDAPVDPRDAAPQRHPVNDVPDAVTRNFNTGTGVAFLGADFRPPSCNVAGLKSNTATLSDRLAKLATEDPSVHPGLSDRGEAKSNLLNILQYSLQTSDLFRSIVGEQESRHVAVTGSLEDRIRLLTLENGQLKQGVAAKCLEQRICLLEVENDQLRGRLLRRDQELEERAVKGLEQKMRQLEVEAERLQGRLDQREQAIATVNARVQLADCTLRLILKQDLPVPGDTQIPGLIADTDLKDLISIIRAYLGDI